MHVAELTIFFKNKKRLRDECKKSSFSYHVCCIKKLNLLIYLIYRQVVTTKKEYSTKMAAIRGQEATDIQEFKGPIADIKLAKDNKTKIGIRTCGNHYFTGIIEAFDQKWHLIMSDVNIGWIELRKKKDGGPIFRTRWQKHICLNGDNIIHVKLKPGENFHLSPILIKYGPVDYRGKLDIRNLKVEEGVIEKLSSDEKDEVNKIEHGVRAGSGGATGLADISTKSEW